MTRHGHRAALALVLALALSTTLTLAGCHKGPAEKAGERLDNSVDELTKGHDQPLRKGPAQQAGEDIDKATGN